MTVDLIAETLAAHDVSVDHFRRRSGWCWWCSCETDGEGVHDSHNGARLAAARHQAEHVAAVLAAGAPDTDPTPDTGTAPTGPYARVSRYSVCAVPETVDARERYLFEITVEDRGTGWAVLRHRSRHGPLAYATDRFGYWQDNIRAVALSLQALRAVDRYGVSGSGEQYRGWRAIEAEAPAEMTMEQAAEFLAAHGDAAPADLLADAGVVARAFRTAARELHPDRGGDPEQFRRLVAARQLLETGEVS